MKTDVYERITNRIVAELEQGVRPWLQPWNAEHAAGRITRPLRAGGLPYQGINVLMLWGEAALKGYAAPIWMTFRQAKEILRGGSSSAMRLCMRCSSPNPSGRWPGGSVSSLLRHTSSKGASTFISMKPDASHLRRMSLSVR